MNIGDIAPFSAIIGALLGAAAAYVFGLRIESRKNYSRLRTDAYIDFIKSVAGIAIAQRNTDAAKEAEATASLADAKTRIAIYGSPEAATALATFFRQHGTLDTTAALSSFVNLVSLMRSETPGGRRRQILARDIGQILFGTDTN